MPRYFAFLRAINVGGHTVKMERLRTLFEALGFDNVKTFIASGNVIFDCRCTDAAALEEQIEQRLKEALGYEVGTFLRSAPQLAAIAAYQPFPPDATAGEPSLYILFLKTAPGEEVRQKLAALRTETDDFHAHGREVYWQCRTRMSDSPVGALLGKVLGTPGTMRNITTPRRLAAKFVDP